MYERSSAAPQAWAQHDTEAHVRDVVLELEPDVVVFQELPGQVPFIETHDMIRANPRSHSGNLATLVRHELLDSEADFATVEGCAVVTTLKSINLTIANVHLSPGPGSEAERRDQLASIVQASKTEDLIIVGDTNTRIDEVDDLVTRFSLLAPKPPQPTWNSKTNNFRAGDHRFTAYFTRCFVTPSLRLTEQVVRSQPVEHGGQQFHVSDHFALYAKAASANVAN